MKKLTLAALTLTFFTGLGATAFAQDASLIDDAEIDLAYTFDSEGQGDVKVLTPWGDVIVQVDAAGAMPALEAMAEANGVDLATLFTTLQHDTTVDTVLGDIATMVSSSLEVAVAQ